MFTLRSWILFILLFVQYLLYRVGLARPPDPRRHYREGLAFMDSLFGFTKGLRLVHAERCPKSGPAVIAGNHIRLSDPFVTGCAINIATRSAGRAWAMMRDDFFTRLPRCVRRFVDPDEVALLLGAIPIRRQNIGVAQLDPFVELLCESGMFLIYPGRSRSQSGMFVEYRGWIRTPGATSYFPAQAQHRRPDLKVAVVPVTRTYNPVSQGSALVFGEWLYLPASADRAAQRDFDQQLVVAMGGLVEVNVPQVLSAWLYLCCLHTKPQEVGFATLCRDIRQVFAHLRERLIDPAADACTESEVARTLRYLRRRGILCLRKDRIEMNREAILRVPPSGQRYQDANPVKYLANQILHLRDVIDAVERVVLG